MLGQRIKIQQNVKYLELRLDDKINFETHTKHMESKIACNVDILTILK